MGRKIRGGEKAKPEDSMRKIYKDGEWIPVKPVLYKGIICGCISGQYIPYRKIGPVKIK